MRNTFSLSVICLRRISTRITLNRCECIETTIVRPCLLRSLIFNLNRLNLEINFASIRSRSQERLFLEQFSETFINWLLNLQFLSLCNVFIRVSVYRIRQRSFGSFIKKICFHYFRVLIWWTWKLIFMLFLNPLS